MPATYKSLILRIFVEYRERHCISNKVQMQFYAFEPAEQLDVWKRSRWSTH